MGRRERGRQKRNDVSGPGQPGTPATQELAPYFSSWVLENVFGDLWSRPALGDKNRVLITMTALVVREQQHQLKGYVATWLAEPTPERGGKSRRCVKITRAGLKALATAHADWATPTRSAPAAMPSST